jgi:hypothetical protein
MMSFLQTEKSILAPKFTSAKHISNKVVIKPPLPISCPARILFSKLIPEWY